jgi:hypothetical protein
MAQRMTRTHFTPSTTSSTFVRLLTELASTEIADSKQSFAERLSLWLDWSDAISLSAALNGAGAPTPPHAPTGVLPPASAIFEEFARVRADLVKSITTDGLFTVDKASMKPPTPSPDTATDNAMDFSPYRRQYLAHQRAMAERIALLRVNVRTALSKRSPSLSRLAALDAVLDEALSARERHLLSHVTPLLEKRFKHLRESHLETMAETQQTDWWPAYRKDMQHVLLAELDMRLQPIEGMMEAMGHEATRQQ